MKNNYNNDIKVRNNHLFTYNKQYFLPLSCWFLAWFTLRH
jgi:hypothetical protein